MKRFNQLTEKEMSNVNGGLLMGLLIAGVSFICVGVGSVVTYVANGYNNDKQ